MKYARCDNVNKIYTDSLAMIATNTTTNAAASAAGATTTTAAGTSTNCGVKVIKKTMSPATSSGFLSDSSPTPIAGNSASNFINNSICSVGGSGSSNSNRGSMLFSDEFCTVENLFEKWSDCERTVVMYALLKRLRYPCLKFLQYSIDNNLTQHAVAQSTMNAVIADINANNPSYLQNLLNAYNNLHNLNDISDAFNSTSSSSFASASATPLTSASVSTVSASSMISSTSSSSCSSAAASTDKESMPCYGPSAVTNNCDERKIYAKKEDILNEILNILPLLKPGNEDAKTVYLSLIPNAVKDTIKQIVPAELVQQIFSYLLIHPAVTSDDRRSLNVWLRQLEDFLQNSQRIVNAFFMPPSKSDFHNSNSLLSNDSLIMNSVCSASASSSCSSSSTSSATAATSCNSVNNTNISSICGNSSSSNNNSTNNSFAAAVANLPRNSDWQTIAPPSKLKQQLQQQPKIPQLSDWCDVLAARRRQSSGAILNASLAADHQLCDNFNGITLNELSSSQSVNSLGLGSLVEDTHSPVAVAVNVVVSDGSESSLVNGVAAAAASAESALFSANSGQVVCAQSNPIINIISNTNCDELLIGGDDHDTSFSKNGTDFDFEPPTRSNAADSNNLTNTINQFPSSAPKDSFGCSPQPQPFASLFMNNNNHHEHPEQIDAAINRWSLDSKIAALKTRRSNSLTTQTISTSSSTSSSNSSVITVNDNCSNSTEDLAQFANKPRSFSLSIENQQQQQQRNVLMNGSSDTRLDDFKPNYIRFQTRNVGMSSIGAWLKSLRLHKYIELFHNMTYEEMLQISEVYLQNVGVTKGASHKLAICIEKLKERTKVLIKLEQDLLSGKVSMHKAVEDLTNIVLTPMKPVEAVNATLGEDNVALMFLRVVDLVCSIVQRDPYALPEDDNLSSIIWILDRAIHCEAFVNHINQLKDLKFQISKLKIAFAPRLHYNKNGGAGGGGGGGGGAGSAMNKARWNGKLRKCDSKNGSNDRINYRKNSGDMNNLPLVGGLSQQQQQQQQQQNAACGVEGYQISPNNSGGNNSQYKNSTYSSYVQQQAQTNAQQQQQQQQQQNGRSMSNLIVVTGGLPQPQKIIFNKNGSHQQQQGVLSMTHSIRSSTDNLQMDNVAAAPSSAATNSLHLHHHQQKKTMAAVVMENLSKFDQHFTLF